MSSICSACGNTKNPVGATTCTVCHQPLSGAVAATLTDPKGRRYSLSPSSPTLIGSRGCAILLSGAGIEDRHARITPIGGAFYVEPLQGTLLLNGSVITKSTLLPPGATLTLGSTTLTYGGPTALPVVSGALPSISMTTPPSPPLPTVVPLAPSTIPSTPSTPTLKSAPPGAILEGEIVFVEGPHEEDADMDWAGFLMRTTFGLFLLPILCWQPALIIPFLLYGTRTQDRRVPTRNLRVQDASGTQHTVKMKGDLTRGMLSSGDHAAFWGRWEGGNLKMERGWNRNTNSEVRLKPVIQRRRSKYVLLFAVFLMALLLFPLFQQ